MEKQFMLSALSLADKAITAGTGGPFGAVIVCSGKIIGEGYNQVVSLNDPTAHAEIIAIREACKQKAYYHLPECEIYTTSEPCPMCMSALYWARIKRIYYINPHDEAARIGFDDSFIQRELQLPDNEKSIEIHQCIDERIKQSGLMILEKWHAQKNKRLY